MWLFHLSDAYIKSYGSHCLRIGQEIKGSSKYVEFDRRLDINHAKEECSKSKICLGLEPILVLSKLYFKMCLDSIYTSLAWDRYKNATSYLYKKVDTYGKYT